jgi:hypothetical protein
MKYAVEMRTDPPIYEPSSMKNGSGIQKLIKRVHRHADRMMISYAYFYFLYQNKERMLR